MSLKSFLSKIVNFIAGIWNSANKDIKKIVPIAIEIVNAIKQVNESTTADVLELIITRAIPSNADDIFIRKLREKLSESLPKVILALNISKEIADIEDKNEQLKRILVLVNLSSDETKNVYYHGFASLVIESLSDGKLTWSESAYLSEYFYKYIYKK